MLKGVSVKKFIAIIAIITFILMVGFLVVFSAVTERKIEEPAILAAFTGMVGLIVGQYFGQSTMSAGAHMNKDP